MNIPEDLQKISKDTALDLNHKLFRSFNGKGFIGAQAALAVAGAFRLIAGDLSKLSDVFARDITGKIAESNIDLAAEIQEEFNKL